MSLDTLKFVLDNHPVKAVFTIPNFNNPLGFAMPDEKKREMVKLLEKYKVTLIEDDIYGDLYYETRPSTCKSYDTSGNVILCSSITKTVAPGLRIGWVVPGNAYYDEITRLKTLLNISTAGINRVSRQTLPGGQARDQCAPGGRPIHQGRRRGIGTSLFFHEWVRRA